MEEKLIELENELIVTYPARLQKDKITLNQFKEYKDINAVEFNIKSSTGIVVKFICMFKDKKFILRSCFGDETFKKSKEIIKYINKQLSI